MIEASTAVRIELFVTLIVPPVTALVVSPRVILELSEILVVPFCWVNPDVAELEILDAFMVPPSFTIIPFHWSLCSGLPVTPLRLKVAPLSTSNVEPL